CGGHRRRPWNRRTPVGVRGATSPAPALRLAAGRHAHADAHRASLARLAAHARRPGLAVAQTEPGRALSPAAPLAAPAPFPRRAPPPAPAPRGRAGAAPKPGPPRFPHPKGGPTPAPGLLGGPPPPAVAAAPRTGIAATGRERCRRPRPADRHPASDA